MHACMHARLSEISRVTCNRTEICLIRYQRIYTRTIKLERRVCWDSSKRDSAVLQLQFKIFDNIQNILFKNYTFYFFLQSIKLQNWEQPSIIKNELSQAYLIHIQRIDELHTKFEHFANPNVVVNKRWTVWYKSLETLISQNLLTILRWIIKMPLKFKRKI